MRQMALFLLLFAVLTPDCYSKQEEVIRNDLFESIATTGSRIVSCNVNNTAILNGVTKKLECLKNSDINRQVAAKFFQDRCKLEEKQSLNLWYGNFQQSLNCSITELKIRKVNGQWGAAPNVSCFRFISNELKNVCKDLYLSGRLFLLNFQCIVPGATALPPLCILFTIPGKTGIDLPLTNLTNSTKIPSILNTTMFTPMPTTSVPASSLPKRNVTHHTEGDLFVYITVKTTLPNHSVYTDPVVTNKPSPNSKTVILYIILAGVAVLMVLAMCLVYYFCCSKKRKQEQKMQLDTPLLEMVLQDDTYQTSEALISDELYAKPKKKSKNKLKILTEKKDLLPTWEDYDQVGSLITGTYETQESNESKTNNTEYSYAKILRESPKLLVVEAPYTTIVGRSNSFSPGPKRGQTKDEKSETKDEAVDIKNDSSKEETKLDNKQLTDDFVFQDSSVLDSNVNSFKPKGSVKIKQHRTSTKRGRSNQESSVPLRALVHEDVHITPPVSKRSSPELDRKSDDKHYSHVDVARNKNLPAVPERSTSMKKAQHPPLKPKRSLLENNPDLLRKSSNISVELDHLDNANVLSELNSKVDIDHDYDTVLPDNVKKEEKVPIDNDYEKIISDKSQSDDDEDDDKEKKTVLDNNYSSIFPESVNEVTNDGQQNTKIENDYEIVKANDA